MHEMAPTVFGKVNIYINTYILYMHAFVHLYEPFTIFVVYFSSVRYVSTRKRHYSYIHENYADEKKT